MATPPATTPVAAQVGKPPFLLGTSPKDLRTFVNHAKLFFTLKKITDDPQKILWLGAGLSLVPELEA